MGFKSDREFLRNVSIGAIGTRRIAAILKQGGFRIIELERYCSSNKIWGTKIKRLRVPDLLCLRSGLRIECRAKAELKLTMSHSVKNPQRAWDKGLRDGDLVAFIRCWPAGDSWATSERVALFRVGDMRATQGLAKLEPMKSASQGSEVQITWPATIPSKGGTVADVSSQCINTVLCRGRRQSYRLGRESERGPFSLTPHVKIGDAFGDGDTILASAVPTLVTPLIPECQQYDFFADLECDTPETVYAGVKALGFVPELATRGRTLLSRILVDSEDERIRLEAAASLARLGYREGWEFMASIVNAPDASPQLRMECALILAELPDPRSIDLLRALMENSSNHSELRAAGAWGLASVSTDPESAGLLTHVADSDELTAVHAILAVSRLITSENLESLLGNVGFNDRQSAGLARAVLLSRVELVPTVVRLIRNSKGQQRRWFLYLLASRGRAACVDFVRAEAPDLLEELDFFWTHHVENWTNRLDVADQIDFLQGQMLE